MPHENSGSCFAVFILKHHNSTYQLEFSVLSRTDNVTILLSIFQTPESVERLKRVLIGETRTRFISFSFFLSSNTGSLEYPFAFPAAGIIGVVHPSQAMPSSGTDSYVMEKHCFCSLQELRLPFVASLRQDLRDGAGWGGRYGARLRGRCGPLTFPRSRSFSTRPGKAGTAAVAKDEDMAASMTVANMAGIPNISKKNGRLYTLVANSGLLKRQAYLDVQNQKLCVLHQSTEL